MLAERRSSIPGMDSLTLRGTSRGSASHLRLLGRPLRGAAVADFCIARDVGRVVLWQVVLCQGALLLLRRVGAVGGGVLVVAAVGAHGAVFCCGEGMERNVKVYTCRRKEGGIEEG